MTGPAVIKICYRGSHVFLPDRVFLEDLVSRILRGRKYENMGVPPGGKGSRGG